MKLNKDFLFKQNISLSIASFIVILLLVIQSISMRSIFLDTHDSITLLILVVCWFLTSKNQYLWKILWLAYCLFGITIWRPFSISSTFEFIGIPFYLISWLLLLTHIGGNFLDDLIPSRNPKEIIEEDDELVLRFIKKFENKNKIELEQMINNSDLVPEAIEACKKLKSNLEK